MTKRYYFDSAIMPAIFWIDLDKVDLKAGAPPKKIDVDGRKVLAGEVSAELKKAKPLVWLKAKK